MWNYKISKIPVGWDSIFIKAEEGVNSSTTIFLRKKRSKNVQYRKKGQIMPEGEKVLLQNVPWLRKHFSSLGT